MNRPLLLGCLALWALAAGGCNCVPGQASCDYRPTSKACQDLLTNRNNQLRPTLENLCTLGGGTFSDDLCNHQGALGGCLCEGCENGRSVTWFFTDTADGGVTSADAVKKKCASASQSYVDP